MDLTKEQLAYLAASICASYGIISNRQAEHMTIQSFSKYTKKMFVDTMKIGMAMHGYENKIEEFEEKINDPKFDCLFRPGTDVEIPPEEEIVSEEDLPDNVVIEKEDDQCNG